MKGEISSLTHQHLDTGLGAWTPGADEAERFREDLHLRILGTTQAISHLLDETASGVLRAIQDAAAKGALHDEREDVEMAKVDDCAEHERYVYNWAHVMRTTRVVDVLRALSWLLSEVVPKGNHQGYELKRLGAEFTDRFHIALGDAPNGIGFLEGMVLARDKIVHNAGMAWEASSQPDVILSEGAPAWSPKTTDQTFVQRFPEYVDGIHRISVTKEVLKRNAEQSQAFVTWLTARFDAFVQLLTAETTTPS